MSPPACKSAGKRVLLVEGTDDCHVVMAFCERRQVQDGLFGIYDSGGRDQLLSRLSALAAAPADQRPEVVGAVLDADSSVADRWAQVVAKTHKHGYALPRLPKADGEIVALAGKPTLGIWIMPDNSNKGALEDFLWTGVPEDARKFAVASVSEARTRGHASFLEAHTRKAQIHTYLAWQDTPGRPLGASVTCRVLRVDNEICDRFQSWLEHLFARTADQTPPVGRGN